MNRQQQQQRQAMTTDGSTRRGSVSFFLIQTKIREKVQFKGLAKGGEPHDGPKLQNRV